MFKTDTILELALEETFDYLRDLKAWSAETPLQKYREIMGVPLPVVWDTLMPDHTDHMKREANELFQKKLVCSIRRDKGQLYPGVMELLSYLNGYTIGRLSSTTAWIPG